MNTLFIFTAQYLFLLSPLLAGIYFLRESRTTQKRMIVLGIVAAALTYTVVFIANHLFIDPRPFVVGHFTPLVAHDPDNGFPSDHAVLTALIASIIYIFHRKLGLTLFVISILVSLSRVYVGIHHPIDVIDGMLISILMTSIAFFICKKYGAPHIS